MKRAAWPSAIDGRIRGDLEELLDRVAAKFRLQEEEDHLVTYEVETREGSGLAVSIDLSPDLLAVTVGGCSRLIELAAHHPKFWPNPRAFEDWREECFRTVEGLLTSDLRLETRSRDGVVRGGWLWRRDGETWVFWGGGGDTMMFFGEKHVTEYRDWLAR